MQSSKSKTGYQDFPIQIFETAYPNDLKTVGSSAPLIKLIFHLSKSKKILTKNKTKSQFARSVVVSVVIKIFFVTYRYRLGHKFMNMWEDETAWTIFRFRFR